MPSPTRAALTALAAVAVLACTRHRPPLTPAPAAAPPTAAATLPASAVVLPTSAIDTTRSAVYGGRYTFGFEVSRFEPCSGREAWWVVLSARTLAQRDSALRVLGLDPRGSGPVAVVWRGRAGGRMVAGHMGAYQRYFLADDLLSLSIAEPAATRACAGSR